MKFLTFLIILILSLNTFAEKKVMPARMGKIGSIHSMAWRESDKADVVGEGKFYDFKISIFKNEDLIDEFLFRLNEASIDTKKSKFEISGDLEEEVFGSKIKVNFKDIEDKKASVILDIDTKILEKLLYKNNSRIPIFTSAKKSIKANISINERYICNLENSIKIEILATETKD